MNGWVTGIIKRDFKLSQSIAPEPVTFETYLKTDVEIRKFLKLD